MTHFGYHSSTKNLLRLIPTQSVVGRLLSVEWGKFSSIRRWFASAISRIFSSSGLRRARDGRQMYSVVIADQSILCPDWRLLLFSVLLTRGFEGEDSELFGLSPRCRELQSKWRICAKKAKFALGRGDLTEIRANSGSKKGMFPSSLPTDR